MDRNASLSKDLQALRNVGEASVNEHKKATEQVT